MSNVQEKLAAIQKPRVSNFRRTANVCKEEVIVTIPDFLAKYPANDEHRIELLDVLKTTDYPAETHSDIADLAARFEPSDRFIKAVIIGSRTEGRIFLHEEKPTYSQFHLAYYKTNDLTDFYEFVIRVVAQEGFVDSQKMMMVERLDLSGLETPKSNKKK